MQANAGTLGGKGTIAGEMTVGSGIGTGALLAPSVGTSTPVTLTIQGAITFKADATYDYKLDSTFLEGDRIIANGVAIDDGAQFTISDIGSVALPPGTILTVIDNAAATPISGTFINLADGGTITVDSNTFQVDYEGGDGNDLTLTIVP